MRYGPITWGHWSMICAVAWSAMAADGVRASGAEALELANNGYQLRVAIVDGTVRATLVDKTAGFTVADGPVIYHADTLLDAYTALAKPKIAVEGETLSITGELAGLNVTHTFTLPASRAIMEERIALHGEASAKMGIHGLEIGLTRRVTGKEGKALPELAGDRWVAVPFRNRPTDTKEEIHDFAIAELPAKAGYEPRMDLDQRSARIPAPHRYSEGWAWTHGEYALGIFSFCQENMVFCTVSGRMDPEGGYVRFGGACMLAHEPAALTRIEPGQTVKLGVMRYQTVPGGYREAMYAYRAMLDENGCRFPKGFNPPVHWEQLYDMPDAWNDRPHRYTRAIVEKEAAKGVAYSCEALYLDPGWDTVFGNFLWGESWLGPRKKFIDHMQSQYGLKVSLHCPLATWVSHRYTWGADADKEWPKAARRVPPTDAAFEQKVAKLRVPAVRDGRRNLALAPAAKAEASSLLAGFEIHQIAHLNDGWYGNAASWIPAAMPAWAQIDLGSARRINEVVLSNDFAGEFHDRAATRLRILVATEYAADSKAASWQQVAEYQGAGLPAEQKLTFPAMAARWVRVELLEAKELPRLDEIEVYTADAAPAAEATAFAESAKRRENAFQPPGPTLCLGSKQYLDEAEKRLLANCADGAVFLMYDGNWWNGGCMDPQHGHPVPYEIEDHVRANIDLVQRVHAKHPNVLIELHDPVAGGNPARFVPVYYKYGLPGSFDDNWAFELMWDPMEDLRQGRGRSLYYYNLSCNVPLYLHIDLRRDNEDCVVLWWYASTCRHLGIGGTNPNPKVVAAEQQAMKFYKPFERFYKRGDFYGINEDIHVHVLPEERAFVVNIFNTSDTPKTISGSVELKTLGLDAQKAYALSAKWAKIVDGRLEVKLDLPAWGARVAEGH